MKYTPTPLDLIKPHDLLDFVEQCFACVIEKQMRFVEEERKFRLVDVPDFRKLVIERRKHP